MSLATPEKIRTFQRKLYCKAKAEPAFRFRLRGPTGAKDEFLLAATAQNLRKLAKLIVPAMPKRLAAP